MKWIIPLLLAATASLVSAETEITEEPSLEGSKVQIPCGDFNNYVWKAWIHGLYAENEVVTNTSAFIYRTLADGTVDIDSTDSKTSVDNSPYHLTVSDIQLSNSFDYTCRYKYTVGLDTKYKDMSRTKLSPYVQPVITIKTKGGNTPGDEVTVNCTIPRLYPVITSDKFIMSLKDSTFEEIAIDGDLYAKKYTRSGKLKLQQGDQTVKCEVIPKLGQNTSEQETIKVSLKPTLTLTGLYTEGCYKVDTALNVTCILTDGSPSVNLDTFQIKWGTEIFSKRVDITPSGDKYKTYKIEGSQVLTTGDEAKTISCSAQQDNGDPVEPKSSTDPLAETLAVWRKPPDYPVSAGGLAGIIIGSMAGGALIGAGVVVVINISKKKK